MIQNKVAESGIITLDIEKLMPSPEEMAIFDLAPFLFKGLILREKDFREALKNHDFSTYAGKYVGITCTADALIPMWAYMLVMTYLQGVCKKAYHATVEDLNVLVTIDRINSLDTTSYTDARVVIKGCGNTKAEEAYYIHISQTLLPHVKSLMFGEPCSTVPIYKKKKATLPE